MIESQNLQAPASEPPAPLVGPPPIKIGSVVVDPPILQAPMAGYTNYAFRQIVREYGGAGLLATEMVSAQGFMHIQEDDHPSHPRLWGVADEARPLAVQMWDNNPDILAAVGAQLANDFRVSVVDINFGCPVKQVTEHAHSGSYLLRFPDRVGRIVEKVAKACHPTPVTAKIRLGCTLQTINACEIAEVVEQAGASALTVHGRTAQEFFKGKANWDRIAEVKSHLKRIPLIGNGDVTSAQRVAEIFRTYPVDGVMIARAALGRPWLFRQAAAAIRGLPIPPDPTLAEERELLLHHWRLLLERFPQDRAAVLMRKFACCYAQGKPFVRDFRSKVVHVLTRQDFEECVENYFPRDEWLTDPARAPAAAAAAVAASSGPEGEPCDEGCGA